MESLIDETLRLGRSGEALMAAASLIAPCASAIGRVFEVDDSPDLAPELRVAMDNLVAAGEAVVSCAQVIEARYVVAVERLAEAAGVKNEPTSEEKQDA